MDMDPALLATLGWQTDPVLIGTLVTLAAVYGLAAGPLRSRLAPDAPFPTGRAIWYYAGLALLFLAEGSPLHDLSELYLLSAHMLQHLLVAYLVAPMILRGVPDWMWRPLLLNRAMRPVSRVVTTPVVAFAIFALAFALWHLPAIYDGALRNSSLHHGEHVIFLLTALIMWWPLMSELPELPRMSSGLQVLYLFALPVSQMPVFGAITFSDRPLYDTYAAAPRLLIANPLHDQAIGGVVMKVSGLFVFGIPLGYAFLTWFARENGAPRRAPGGAPR